MTANDRQVGGGHYKQNGDTPQHWDIVIAHNLDYFQAQITKYVMRWKLKDGLQDLEKAAHFLEKYMEAIRAGADFGHTKLLTSAGFTIVSPGAFRCRKCGTVIMSSHDLIELQEHSCAGNGYVDQG